MAERTYLPAAGHDWALPFYDPCVKLIGGDRTRRVMIDQAALQPRHRVLEIGCGTGTLLMMIKRLSPSVEVVGLDPDPKALARAAGKAERAAASIRLDRAFSGEMPYPDNSFDRVFSSFMFHHLEGDEKQKTLREVLRVLQPRGSFHMADFGGPDSKAGVLGRLVHSGHHLHDNSVDRVLTLMRQAGFADPQRVQQGTMLFGQIRVNYFKARRD